MDILNPTPRESSKVREYETKYWRDVSLWGKLLWYWDEWKRKRDLG